MKNYTNKELIDKFERISNYYKRCMKGKKTKSLYAW